MSLDAKIPDGPIEEQVGAAQVRREAGEPGQQAAVRDHRRRQRARRRVGRGDRWASSATRSTLFTFHDSPRRAHSIAAQGGINAAKNYHNDGDSVYAALLRHRQGRRLPRPRGQRVPARAGERQHHRPVRRAGRAVRARVRRPARQPLVRWRAGVAHVLRARPDRPAAAARRVPGAHAPGRARHRHAARPQPRCSTSS